MCAVPAIRPSPRNETFCRVAANTKVAELSLISRSTHQMKRRKSVEFSKPRFSHTVNHELSRTDYYLITWTQFTLIIIKYFY